MARDRVHGIGFSDELVWRIPDAPPGGEAVIRNWSRNGRRYVDQVVGVEVPDWETALDWFAGVADRLGVNWFLFGTAGLAIAATDDWPVSTHTGQLFRGAPISVIAGILDRDWPTPWDSAGRDQLEPVTWRNHTIRTTSLGRELEYARRMARFGLARAIVRRRVR